MSDTVYVLGAGANQVIENWDGLRPPLMDNFFQVALKMKKYSNGHYNTKIQVVYDYIKKYWRKEKSDLIAEAFDLEECFTMLELQLRNAIDLKNNEKIDYLLDVQFKLKSFFAEVLSDFQTFAFSSKELQQFGETVVNDKPTIITFNYDCFIEACIELASRPNSNVPEAISKKHSILEKDKITNEEISYSHFNWNRPLGYGIKFDEIQLQQAGISRYVKADKFYSHPKNKLYPWHILKLHGSLNWFKYLPIHKSSAFFEEESILPENKKSEIILVNGNWWFNEPPYKDDWYIDPIIITPVLYKDNQFQEPLNKRVFDPIWNEARDTLSRCKKLIIIGYSFPPTDFPAKKLFLEAFSESTPEILIVVNPDTSIISKIKELCHFEKPIIVCKNLKEFLQLKNIS